MARTRLRPGARPDVTVLCYGGMLPDVERAAVVLFDEHEVVCEVICPTQLYPLNGRAIADSVVQSGRLLIVEEGQTFAAFGAEVCRSFVETEILALGDYELIGDITGPLSKTLDAGGDSTTIENIYEAEVRFTFQGTEFEVLGDFVAADAVYWVAICR